MTTARTYTAPIPPLPSHEGRAVALDDILAARDARVARQQALLQQGGMLLSLTSSPRRGQTQPGFWTPSLPPRSIAIRPAG